MICVAILIGVQLPTNQSATANLMKLVNLYRGELYGFPHYLHVNCIVPARVKYVWPDVICKYWPWAEKVDLPADMKPALSVMHAKAHNWNCQVSDNPSIAFLFVASW